MYCLGRPAGSESLRLGKERGIVGFGIIAGWALLNSGFSRKLERIGETLFAKSKR